MELRTFTEKDVRGKKVLLRVDFNVPVKEGKVTDTTRIGAHRETIERLRSWGARIALVSHLGRPKGKRVPDMSLACVLPELKQVLGMSPSFCDEAVGPKVRDLAEGMRDGDVVLLENIRFYPEEQENDRDFARRLAAPFDVFVMDAFSAAHRANASTSAVMEFLPSFSGSLMLREIAMLSAVSQHPELPFVLVLGGAKVSDKIAVVDNLMKKASAILIGGGMAFTFLRARGGRIGKSLFEEEKAPFALEMMRKGLEMGVEIVLPVDVVAAPSPDASSGEVTVPADEVPEDMMGLDIGPRTVALFSGKVASARTVLWNGPMGVFENPVFAGGTKGLAGGIAECTRRGGITVIGGGDTAAAAKSLGFDGLVSHVSTGGGASLEFCEGKDLPGIVPLCVRR